MPRQVASICWNLGWWRISLSCSDSRWSICAMRWLIIASRSGETVIWPSSTWLTNSETRVRPHSRAASSRPTRPSWTIWSRRLGPVVTVAAAAAAGFSEASRFAMGLSVLGFLCRHLGAHLLELGGVVDDVLQQALQLLVALKGSYKIGELGSQLQQLAQRLHPPGHLLRLEFFNTLKRQVHAEIAGVGFVAQFVFHREGYSRLHAVEDRIEIIRCDFDEAPVFELGQGVGRLTAQIGQYSHYKRDFFEFDRIADLHVVCDVDSWRAYSLQFRVNALACHEGLQVRSLSSTWNKVSSKIAIERK